MLKITPYLGIIVMIISLWRNLLPKARILLAAGLCHPMVIAPFRGRWFCGNLCPRGSFVDFWLGPIGRKVRISSILRSMWIGIPIFIVMGFMIFRIIGTNGIVDKVGMVFVTICISIGNVPVRYWC